jgi:hypothetical protein
MPWIPFYIGKGFGNRMFIHEKKALRPLTYKTNHNLYLRNKILKILKEGNKIYYHKFNDNVSEEDAFACEITAIATFRSAGIKLCNITDGGEGKDTLSNHPNRKEICKKLSESSWNKGKHGLQNPPWNKGKYGYHLQKKSKIK